MPDRGEQHRPLKVWQAVAFLEPAVLLELAEAAEASGFFGIMVSDHLVYPGVLETRYPRSRSADGAPGWDPATPWPDPWVAIAAMAARTTSLQFGTNICVAPTWNIFRLAKQVSTAAVLSAGRVRLGVGAGWMREEFDCAGTDFANRGARLDELLAAVRALWGPDWVEFHGTFYDFGPLRLSPRPTGTIPIDCGGHGRRGLRRAARHGDGWIGGAYDDDELDALLAILDEELAAVGRSGDTAFEVVATPDAVPEADTYRRWADKGLTGVIVPPTALCGDDAPSSRHQGPATRRFGAARPDSDLEARLTTTIAVGRDGPSPPIRAALAAKMTFASTPVPARRSEWRDRAHPGRWAMPEQLNAVLMRRGYNAFSSGDLETLTEVFAENAAWHEPGNSPIAGDYVGRDRVFEFFGKLTELSGGTFRADPVHILADGERGVAIQHSTGRRNGRTLDTSDVLVFEVRDGRVVDVQLYPSDVEQENAFWS